MSDNPVKSIELGIFTQEEADTFDNTVGIKNRYLASDDVCVSDLCFDAAQRLIEAFGWEKDSIDVLVFGSVTEDYKTPPASSILQDRLGLPTSTFCFEHSYGLLWVDLCNQYSW